MKRLEDLSTYMTGEMSDADADAFEDAMFASPDADDDVAFLDRVVRHASVLVEHHTYELGVMRTDLEDLAAKGHKIQISDAGPPGGEKSFQIEKSCEFFATVLRIGRPDLARVDVEVFIPSYNMTKTIKDVPVDPTDGTVYGLCERALAELGFGMQTHVTVRENTGARAVVAEWDLFGSVAQ